jgi:RNA polymerase sigma-70 factor (ECF subfamily)
MNENEDRIFIENTLNGNVNSFGKLIDKYQKPVYNIAFRILQDIEAAKDITQDVFIKAYNKLEDYDKRYKFFSWLYRIAINESINCQKSGRRFTGLDSMNGLATQSVEHDYVQKETDHNLHLAVSKLQDDHKLLIILKYFEDLSYDEISEVTNLSVKKVKSRLFTARQQLKLKLQTKQGSYS